jgi:hypothetical protein
MISEREELHQLTFESTLYFLSYVYTTQVNAMFAKMKPIPIMINAIKIISNPATVNG